MLYFKVNATMDVVAISETVPPELNTPEGWKLWHRHLDGSRRPGWLNRNDIRNFHEAYLLAESATKLSGKRYIPTDAGEHVAPRFDVKEAPAVGDLVSHSFNGDSYPDGVIVKISKTLKVVTTSTGKRYHRRGLTGSWVNNGWSLVPGHRYTQNPHF
jgi:hypothetical protein